MTARTTITEGRHYRIDSRTGCWVWLLSLTSDGYGRAPRGVPAHRRSFIEHGGEVAPGQPLDHLCRNTVCVNPAHLEPVTIAENTRRSLVARGLVNRSVCAEGHDMTDAYIEPRTGRRKCRTCRRGWSLDWYRRNTSVEADPTPAHGIVRPELRSVS